MLKLQISAFFAFAITSCLAHLNRSLLIGLPSSLLGQQHAHWFPPALFPFCPFCLHTVFLFSATACLLVVRPSPGMLAGYNCLFSCHFLSLYLSCCFTCSFILSCEAITISLVCLFAQALVFTLVFRQSLLFGLIAFSPLTGCYPSLCQQCLPPTFCFRPHFPLCPVSHQCSLNCHVF